MRKSRTARIPLTLPASLEHRREEFTVYVNSARRNIKNFAALHGWKDLTEEEFMDIVMIFDDKEGFNRALLKLAEADPETKLPATYCAALEKRTLIAVTPEYYARVYPEGAEDRSYEKLLTHEIAHRLHIRILEGDEEAMGPVWFYEGFAIFAADQFSEPHAALPGDEMIRIMNDPERGSYVKYNQIFRYFARKISLKELVSKAGATDFNEILAHK